MIAEQQVKIPIANIAQRPFEDKTQKKAAPTTTAVENNTTREKKKSGEERGRKGAEERKSEGKKSEEKTPQPPAKRVSVLHPLRLHGFKISSLYYNGKRSDPACDPTFKTE